MVVLNNILFRDKLFGEILERFSKFASKHLSKDCISKEEQTVQECDWTDLLIQILQFGNIFALSRFQYRIKMNECEVIGCLAQTTEETQVIIRNFGRIELSLCERCMSKFKSTTKYQE